MATFGRTSGSDTSATVPAANTKSASLFTLTEPGSVTILSAWVTTASAPTKARLFIYNSASNEPTSLVVASPEKTALFNGGLNHFTLTTPQTLLPGSYYLGIHADTDITSPAMNATGTNRTAPDTYSDGTAATFGTTTVVGAEKLVYATYTPLVVVRKMHAYAVVGPPPDTVAIQKLHGYAVLTEAASRRPQTYLLG